MHEPLRDFTRALNGDACALAFLRDVGGSNVEARFEIHRRNRRHALVDCLAARHPVLVALVGDEFFHALASEFVRLEPPRSASLLDYGAGFAAFLDTFPPAQEVACLPDVARLEQAWHEAYHAREAPALALRALAALPVESLLTARFTVHPATRFVSSAHPIASLWHAHQHADVAAPLSRYGAECALIVRAHAEVQVHLIEGGARSFIESLIAGASFEDAASTAPVDIEPVALLRQLIELGAFTEPFPC